MARRKDDESDVEIDGMELDYDCLVWVGNVGEGGADVDAQNAAHKEPRETRCSCKQKWTEQLAVVNAHLCPLLDIFDLRLAL